MKWLQWPWCVVLLAWWATSVPVRAELLGTVEVEVIVFRYTAAANGQEWGVALPSTLLASAVPLASAPASSAGGAGEFTAYPAADLRLTGVVKALNRAAGYEVLAHTAWRQAATSGLAVALTPAPSAEANPALAPPLQGALRLRPAGAALRVDVELLVPAGEQQVNVQAQQNVQLGELRYLDHPLAGVLLQIRPWQAATSDSLPPADLPRPMPSPTQGPAD